MPFLVLVAAFVTLWGVSLARRDASIVDPAWSLAFVLVTALSVPWPDASPRALLVLVLVAAWGFRLAGHLLVRNLAHGEDRRYAAMRARWGARFPWVSLFTVFLLQAGLAWGVAWPLRAVAQAPASAWGPLDVLGLAVFTVGLAFEALGDAQLRRFLADPGNRGRVCDVGLWRYTRHPNYFGDALVHLGFGVFAVAVGAPWTLLGTAVMWFLLLRVSGVALLEKDIAERRPGYREYVARTSAFFPWWPRPGNGQAPR